MEKCESFIAISPRWSNKVEIFLELYTGIMIFMCVVSKYSIEGIIWNLVVGFTSSNERTSSLFLVKENTWE